MLPERSVGSATPMTAPTGEGGRGSLRTSESVKAAVHDALMRQDLPRGTVTFLFTDIEGSTRLLRQLGPELYAEALADHRRVLQDPFVAEGASKSIPRGTRSSSLS